MELILVFLRISSRSVMDHPAELLLTEVLISSGTEDEFVPGEIDPVRRRQDLLRFGDELKESQDLDKKLNHPFFRDIARILDLLPEHWILNKDPFCATFGRFRLSAEFGHQG